MILTCYSRPNIGRFNKWANIPWYILIVIIFIVPSWNFYRNEQYVGKYKQKLWNRHISISLDSQAAIRDLEANEAKSTQFGNRRETGLAQCCWISEAAGIQRIYANEISDDLAKNVSSNLFIDHGPEIRLSYGYIRKITRKWLVNKHVVH